MRTEKRRVRPLRIFEFSAFTLVELIVVITILAILATVGFLTLSGYTDDARSAATKANVRTVYSAILTESTTSGNSPRHYIDHDPAAALSWAFVFVEGKQTALTGGQLGSPPYDSNYSAGNPRWDRLKMNGEKFKLATTFRTIPLGGNFGHPEGLADAAYSTGTLSVGAFDVSGKATLTGKSKAVSYFQVAAASLPSRGAVVMGNYSPANPQSAAGLVRDVGQPSSAAAVTDGGFSGSPNCPADFANIGGSCVPASCKAVKNAYPASGDGTYEIDPDGTGPVPGFSVLCDMVTDGWGWTIIGNSLANGVSDASLPFNATWASLKASGIGTMTSPNANFFISMDRYLAMANAAKPVEYAWFAKSGLPSDPWQKTLQYGSHYLADDGFFTWNGNPVFSISGLVSYQGMKLSTYDNDNDTTTSNCAVAYGSFGWYTSCHNAHIWSATDERSTSCNPSSTYASTSYNRWGSAVCNGYSNRGPDAAGAYNTWYQLKIMIR